MSGRRLGKMELVGRQDVRGMLRMMLGNRNLLYFLSCLFDAREGKHPGDF